MDKINLLYYILSNLLEIDLHNFIIITLFLRYIEPNIELIQNGKINSIGYPSSLTKTIFMSRSIYQSKFIPGIFFTPKNLKWKSIITYLKIKKHFFFEIHYMRLYIIAFI